MPRRIAYILKVFPKLSETFVAAELAELLRRGIEVRILSLLPPRSELKHDIISSAGLEALTCYNRDEFSTVLNEFRPELVHAHFATEAAEAGLDWALERSVPFTFTAHGYDIHRRPPADFSARAAVARAVITVSEANASFISQNLAVPRSHIRVIPCGIDTERFCPSNGAGQGAAAVPLILCVARHVVVKNLGLLLEACALLRRTGLDFRCVLVGDGPCRQELEQQRNDLGLESLVQMPGAAPQSEVVNWWQKATVGVLSSENEGMPVSLMEAASCAVPVVATAVGGIPELVEDGETGLLVPAGDATALAAALERIIRDPSLQARMSQAARKRAEARFSLRHQVDQLLALWSQILAAGGPSPVFVSDPFNAVADPGMPTLSLALDPVGVRNEFKRKLPRLSGPEGKLRVKAIRVVRHKPGKRCVVEYDVRVDRPEQHTEAVTLIGKVRAKRFGKEGYRFLDRLWNSGFDSASPDGISVPEPVGFIPRFQMWFQRKVPGQTATHMLAGAGGVELARRIAEAIHKLHEANVPVERHHTMADELRILHECLQKVAEVRPDWAERLERVLSACDRLGATVPEPKSCGIHRDFYPAQVLVDGSRIYLIDFDLYCLGDPALDIGNFIGHMTEQSLRESGDPFGMAPQEQALAERFIELAGESTRSAVQAYTILTLVRHIYLSTQFSKRQEVTPALLDLCEERLVGALMVGQGEAY